MYGSNDNKKINAGKIAKKKRKANAAALVVKELSCIPLIKKVTTSNNGIPSKPGKTILFDQAITCFTTFKSSIFFIIVVAI